MRHSALAIVLLGLSHLTLGSAQVSSSLTGTWTGSVDLTNRWQQLVCHYVGKAQPPSISLQLNDAAGRVHGALVLAVAPKDGEPCPELRKRYQVEGVVDGSRFTFSDTAGDRWTFERTSDLLKATVRYDGSAPYPHEALAVGFSTPAYDVPLTRLSGTATLTRR